MFTPVRPWRSPPEETQKALDLPSVGLQSTTPPQTTAGGLLGDAPVLRHGMETVRAFFRHRVLQRLLARLLDVPLRPVPISFELQERFSSTGEPLAEPPIRRSHYKHWHPELEDQEREAAFVNDVRARRVETVRWRTEVWRERLERAVNRFPGWDAYTVAFLEGAFQRFRSGPDDMTYSGFCCVCEILNYRLDEYVRRVRFNVVDVDMDGRVGYNDFLLLVYNFDPPGRGRLGRLARACTRMANYERFISAITLEEQLHLGLF